MGPLLSANVLLIVSPMAANNTSDKISCDGPPFFSLAATDFTGTLLVVSIPLCKECVRVNTPEPFRGRQTHLGVKVCSVHPGLWVFVRMCVFMRMGATQNNRPGFVPAMLAALITAFSTSSLDSWVGLWKIHNEAMPQISTGEAAFEETAQVVRS